MRDRFTKQANFNTEYATSAMNPHLSNVWKLADSVGRQLVLCIDATTSDDVKRYHCTIMLSNTYADLLCCLDTIERGHDRTIQNNTRMILEDTALAWHIYQNDEIYTKFIESGLTQADIRGNTMATLKNKFGKKIGEIFGDLSDISHHLKSDLLARQLIVMGPNKQTFA